MVVLIMIIFQKYFFYIVINSCGFNLGYLFLYNKIVISYFAYIYIYIYLIRMFKKNNNFELFIKILNPIKWVPPNITLF